MKKIMVFFAPGFEEVEALTPVDVLRRAGLDVVMVSVSNTKEVRGARNIVVSTDCVLADADIENADVLVLPGGMPGTNNLNASDVLKAAVLKHAQKEKYVAAICAAPLILGDLGLLKGHNATCYPGTESRLIGANVTEKAVVVSLPFVTANGVGAAMEFSLELVALLLGKQYAHKLAEKMMVVQSVK